MTTTYYQRILKKVCIPLRVSKNYVRCDQAHLESHARVAKSEAIRREGDL